jgi:LCP family protein required for cell wall assembly
MMKQKKKIDSLRIFAAFAVLLGIAYFYMNLFAPKYVPLFLRLGMPHRPMNILVMGTDVVFDRDTHKKLSESGHNDMIVLVRLNPMGGQINLLSIPRDTFAEIPGHGGRKINAAHIVGGPELAVATVQDLLEIPIDRYAVVNPEGIIKLTDLLGGVRIYVDKDMYYKDDAGGLYINLKKGWQNLSGNDANGYLRFRMDPLGDINRAQRQQNFIKALMKKMASPENLWRIPLVAKLAGESVKTDLSLNEIFRMGTFARCLDKDGFNTMLLPGDFSAEDEKPCYWISNMEETEKILVKYFGKEEDAAKSAGSKIEFHNVSVFNNSGDSAAPYSIIRKLSSTRYTISKVITTDRDDYIRTHIIAQKGDSKGARELGDILGIDNVVVSSAGDVISDFTIILCEDYSGKISSSP